jgi:signal transduction histidine kinase
MPSAREGVDHAPRASGFRRRLGDWFGVDSTWERPRPALERGDVLLVMGAVCLGLLSLELVRSVGGFVDEDLPVWLQWVAVITGSGLLLWRRRWPLLVGGLAAVHMFVTGVSMPMVMGQFTLQVSYFVAFLSAVAWARDRRLMVVVVGAILVFMFGWVAWQFAAGTAIQDYVDELGPDKRPGWLPPIPAAIIVSFLVNILFFGGAVIGGQVSWRGARQRARLVEQAETIAAQTNALQRQAVLDERLRIARELHDVVGHHVSVIGVQAGAARRVLTKDPVTAATALAAIETSSRDAVNQMRGLLGTLRDMEVAAPGSGELHRGPEPGVGDLPLLVAERRASGLDMTYDLVEDAPGAAGALPGPVSLTLYRVAQEALANVVRHSTAQSARLVVRVETQGSRPGAEVEVVDDGRPRAGTSGSGLGQLGIRERAQSLGAVVDIGPRVTGGYRVRVRIPLGESGSA